MVGVSLIDYNCACAPGAACEAQCAQTFICGPNKPPNGACLQCFLATVAPNGPCSTDATFMTMCLQKPECSALLDCFKTCPAAP